MKQGKIWGTTQELFNNGTVSVNYLEIKEGGYCSEHRHISKANIFFIISGFLEVNILRGNSEDKTSIGPGQMSRVDPGVYHRFRAVTDVHCLEIYEVKFQGEDIERNPNKLGGIS